ncbi:MAG TPA: hypothetical protein VK589_27435, partial [Chryseolinea sp.]|nr:hypothetical protein [Chryseolinea sp.]
DFNVFYKKFYKLLKDDTLLDDALITLETAGTWIGNHKRKTLINAFAETYFKKLTNKTFGVFTSGPIGHLDEVIFNATDFNFALPFRFQNRGVFGNKNLKDLGPELYQSRDQIKLSDIIASSSCFPVGFEPLVFPDDFIPSSEPIYKKLVEIPAFRDGIGVMDGGLVDNQGVASIVLSQDRRRDNPNDPLKPFDLYIITDVASPYMDKWSKSDDKLGSWREMSYSTFNWNIIDFFAKPIPLWVWLLMAISIVGAMGSINITDPAWFKVLLSFVSGIAFTVSLGYALAKKFLKAVLVKRVSSAIQNVIQKLPAFYRPLLKRFEKIRFGIFERMLRERGSSTVTILNEMFLKQLRRLTYFQIYEKDEWKFRRIMNGVYELTDYNLKARMAADGEDEDGKKEFIAHLDPLLADPGEKINAAAAVAAKMPTTLWFEAEHNKARMLDHLIACGQFTVCYNLLVYLTELQHDPGSPLKETWEQQKDLKALYMDLMRDWKVFRDKPLFMIDGQLKRELA